MTSPLTITGRSSLGKFLGAFVFMLMMVALTGDLPADPGAVRQPRAGRDPRGLPRPGAAGHRVRRSRAVYVVVHREPDHRGDELPGALLLLYVISWPAETAGGTLGAVLKYLSLTEHFGEMVKGIINTKDLVYFCSVIVLALFLTQRSVESAALEIGRRAPHPTGCLGLIGIILLLFAGVAYALTRGGTIFDALHRRAWRRRRAGADRLPQHPSRICAPSSASGRPNTAPTRPASLIFIAILGILNFLASATTTASTSPRRRCSASRRSRPSARPHQGPAHGRPSSRAAPARSSMIC